MINTIKIQTELMKIIKKGNLNRVMWQEADDKMYLTLDGYVMYIIPKCEFYINFEYLEGLNRNLRELIQLDGYRIANSFDKFKQDNKNQLLRILEIDDATCYVDDKFIKSFGKDIYFKIKNRLEQVYVYDTHTDEMIGVVCPVRCND